MALVLVVVAGVAAVLVEAGRRGGAALANFGTWCPLWLFELWPQALIRAAAKQAAATNHPRLSRLELLDAVRTDAGDRIVG